MILTITEGEKIRISNNKLIIIKSESEKEISLKDIRLLVIENIYSSISIQTLLELNNSKVFMIICNQKHQPQLQILDLYSNYKVTERIQEQIKWSETKKLNCFRQIVLKKLSHQKDMLYFLDETEGAEYLEKLMEKVNNLNLKSTEIKSIEGVGARIYFQKLFTDKFRRFDNDIINSGLNYGYTLLRSLIIKVIIEKGLHPALGIEHNNIYNNYNLADDIIEVFRPMVDYIVYLNFDNYSELKKEFRHELLKIFFQEIAFNENTNKIDYVIEKYVESLIFYLNETNEKIILPQLVIENYEY